MQQRLRQGYLTFTHLVILWPLVFFASLILSGEAYGVEELVMGRWPIKPEVKFVDQYGEDKVISIGGKSIKYTEWVGQVFDELTADLPSKAYDDYRKTFEQGKNYIRIIF